MNVYDLSGTGWKFASNTQFKHDDAPCSKRRKFSAASWGDSGQIYLPHPATYDYIPLSCNSSVALSRPSNTDESTATGVNKHVCSGLNGRDNEVNFISREEIERCSPSRKDGIDAICETYLRYSYCGFIQDLGMRLGL